jgi:MscS family membrane protein
MHKATLTLTLLFLICLATSGLAAIPNVPPLSKEAEQPANQGAAATDPLGRSTPVGTILGFTKAAQQGNYELAVKYLDTPQSGRSEQQLARKLALILDRGFAGNLAMLSSKTTVELKGSLPATRRLVGDAKTGSASLDIFLDLVERGSNPPIWLFSSETLKGVPETYREFETRHGIERHLPQGLVDNWFLGFPLWHWMALLVVIPLSFAAAWLLTHALISLFHALMRCLTKEQGDQYGTRMAGPVRLLLLALAIYGISILSSSLVTSLFWARVALTLTVVGVTWLSIRLIGLATKLMEGRPQSAATSGRIALMHLVGQLSKALALIVGTVILFYMAGINLTAVLAGLGVGGIAIAFAAQRTLENLFGGIMIISDQSVRVGDFCRAGDHTGTVEHIGLRSTRIRTLARTVVSIPNGQLSTMSLENLTMRDKIWFHHKLSLRYDTTAEQLRYVLTEIQRMLQKRPQVESESARIRFVGFGSSSLDLEVFAYVLETQYEAFLGIQEDLLLRIMDIVEASGTAVAIPAQTTYFARDSALDSAKE